MFYALAILWWERNRFLPAVFAVMDDIAKLAWRLFARFVGPGEEAPAPRPAPIPAE